MALRSLLFSSDAGIAEPVCHALADLGVEAEYCAEAVPAVQKVTQTLFQIVIIDWDNQPEAGLLLQAARERKANERPLTLAIVSSDPAVPKALQAGANSILRKPLMINQVKETLSTACALLRAKANAAATGAGAASSSVVILPPVAPTTPASSGNEKALRAGEFLNTPSSMPGTQIETDSQVPSEQDETPEPVDPLKDLETVAAQFSQRRPEPVSGPPSDSDEPRGLEWYLKKKGIARQAQPQAPAPKPAAAPDKPQLLGFDQTPSESAQSSSVQSSSVHSSEDAKESSEQKECEQQAEGKLFAHMAGESETEKEEKNSRPAFRLGKGAIIGALTLAACAIVATPQAPWHPQVQKLWKHGQLSLHAWLNPQPVTTAPAPAAHESFQRAGDEYKLPVVENIPDATTDPSQIQVVPMVDPTAKKPSNGAADPNAAPADGTGTTPADQTTQPGAQPAQTPVQPNVQVQENPAPQSSQPAGTGAAASSPSGTVATPANTSSQAPSTTTPAQAPAPSAETPRAQAITTVTPIPLQPAAPRNAPQYVAANTHVPSSLKSDMTSMTPEASGNKPIEAAMPSIEPVAVSEAAERALLADQPAIAYPANAKGQQGTVILQVLIGRDGSVQDAKFQQGSLAFAKAAIDGVKLWKFKPYTMNGRPVSVAATMTLIFKPGAVR
ncbi:MAG TPA: TonB family protein [Candidatus Solibacter sp.]|nr:TonB family protein [Candidatus Solibacter sp.]